LNITKPEEWKHPIFAYENFETALMDGVELMQSQDSRQERQRIYEGILSVNVNESGYLDDTAIIVEFLLEKSFGLLSMGYRTKN